MKACHAPFALHTLWSMQKYRRLPLYMECSKIDGVMACEADSGKCLRKQKA